VHQFDPARPSPGGIDTCIRGIAKYMPAGNSFAIVGVDTGGGPSDRKLGVWENHEIGTSNFWFLPVVKLDPGDQNRRVPHSLRLIAAFLRYRRRLPKFSVFQAHRMDTAAALRIFLPRYRYSYFIHTQENGLTGATSDSFWKLAGRLHSALERWVVRGAKTIAVFNREYASKVREWNPLATFYPTWFDPELVIGAAGAQRDSQRILWVGRLEIPKDPELALQAFRSLTELPETSHVSIDIVGSGTMLPKLQTLLEEFPAHIRARVRLRGRLSPTEVAEAMASSGLFLMTSHPGYEGYPRVLVEAMASGLPAVVTTGSDTGGLVDGATGIVTGRAPAEIAGSMLDAFDFDRKTAQFAVSDLSAPTIVSRIYRGE
jgi:glycosyltransferase involved in cell wall biosynthesis